MAEQSASSRFLESLSAFRLSLSSHSVGAVKAEIETAAMALHAPPKGWQVVITRDRHAAALLTASEHAIRGADALRRGELLELCAADLRDAADALAEITGEIAPDDVLETIFSQFCIGK